jgi:ribosomal protein L16 Arg81 hydroxylase
MKISDPLELLGNLSPQIFMRRHWHQKPLVIRQAIPQFEPSVHSIGFRAPNAGQLARELLRYKVVL